MKTDTSQEEERRMRHGHGQAKTPAALEAFLRMRVPAILLTPVEAATLSAAESRHLTGIPVLDEEASEGVGGSPAEQALHQVLGEAAASAPVNVQDRLAMAREMLLRAVSELDMVIAEVGQASDLPKEARLDALTAVSHLDSELKLRRQ